MPSQSYCTPHSTQRQATPATQPLPKTLSNSNRSRSVWILAQLRPSPTHRATETNCPTALAQSQPQRQETNSALKKFWVIWCSREPERSRRKCRETKPVTRTWSASISWRRKSLDSCWSSQRTTGHLRFTTTIRRVVAKMCTRILSTHRPPLPRMTIMKSVRCLWLTLRLE